jgi:hypothetical protein
MGQVHTSEPTSTIQTLDGNSKKKTINARIHERLPISSNINAKIAQLLRTKRIYIQQAWK